MDDFEKDICTKIKKVRTDLGLSQKDYAAELGFGQSYISDIENERKPPTQKLLRRIIEVYKISANWLYGLTDHKSISNSDFLDVIGDKYLAHLNPDLLRTYSKMYKKSKQTVDFSLDFSPVIVSEVKLRINYLVTEGQDLYHKILKINDLLTREGLSIYTEDQKKEDEKLAYGHFRFIMKNQGNSPLDKMGPIELWGYHIELENRRNELKDSFFDMFYMLHTILLHPEKQAELRRQYEKNDEM